MTRKRKSPIRHRVGQHTRNGRTIQEYTRGKGSRRAKSKVKLTIRTRTRFLNYSNVLDEREIQKNVRSLLKLRQYQPKKLSVLIGTPSQMPKAKLHEDELGTNVTRSDGSVVVWINSHEVHTAKQASNVLGHELVESSFMSDDFKKYGKLTHEHAYYHNKAVRFYPKIFKITGKEASWDWWIEREQNSKEQSNKSQRVKAPRVRVKINDMTLTLTKEEKEEYDHFVNDAARKIYVYIRTKWNRTHKDALNLLGEYAQWGEIPGVVTPLGKGEPADDELRALFGLPRSVKKSKNMKDSDFYPLMGRIRTHRDKKDFAVFKQEFKRRFNRAKWIYRGMSQGEYMDLAKTKISDGGHFTLDLNMAKSWARGDDIVIAIRKPKSSIMKDYDINSLYFDELEVVVPKGTKVSGMREINDGISHSN